MAEEQGTGGNAMRGVGIALSGFAVFSFHDAMIKSLGEIHTIQIVFFVVLFSFVPFAMLVAVDERKRSFRPNHPRLVALRWFFSLSGLMCGFYAFASLPLAEAYALLFSAPILITLLAIPVLGERVRMVRGFAIVLGLAGVIVVLQPGTSSLTSGHFAAIGGAISIACVAVTTRRIGSREHAITLVLYTMLGNLIVTGVLLWFVYVPLSGIALATLAAVGVCNVLGQSLLIQAYRSAPAQFIAPMQYSQMLWALAFGALLFDEHVERTVLLGASVIVLSGLLVVWREISVSLLRPVLQNRHLRFAGWPHVLTLEVDMSDRIARLEAAQEERLDRSGADR